MVAENRVQQRNSRQASRQGYRRRVEQSLIGGTTKVPSTSPSLNASRRTHRCFSGEHFIESFMRRQEFPVGAGPVLHGVIVRLPSEANRGSGSVSEFVMEKAQRHTTLGFVFSRGFVGKDSSKTLESSSFYTTVFNALLAVADLAPHFSLFPAEFSSPFSRFLDAHSAHSPIVFFK